MMAPMSARSAAALMTMALALAAVVWTVMQPAPGDAQAMVSADAYEPDNGHASARRLPDDSDHTFHTAGDTDWAIIEASEAGARFVIETTPLSGAVNTMITVHALVGGELVALDANDDHEVFGDTSASGVLFEAPGPGTYYVEVSQAVPGGLGAYRLSVSEGVARRIWGRDRYATAVEVSRLVRSGAGLEGWGSMRGPDMVVVAGGLDPAGALCGSVLAAANDSVLLLTQSNVLTASTRTELARLASSRVNSERKTTVYVIGGSDSVGSAVISALRAVPGVGSVVRLGGSNVAGTSSRVASELRATAGPSDVAFVVNASAWADAISAAPAASTMGAPILFTDAAWLPTSTRSTLASLGVKRVIITGGPVSVSPAVAAQIADITGSEPLRLGGRDRYDVARAVAHYGVDELAMDPRTTVLASGEVFPDALAAACIAWRTDGPVLLTRGTFLSPQVSGFLTENNARILPSYVVGGPNSVSPAVFTTFTGMY